MKTKKSIYLLVGVINVFLAGTTHGLPKENNPNQNFLSDQSKDNSRGSSNGLSDGSDRYLVSKENHLNQFLNRFQFAMDRDVRKGPEPIHKSYEPLSIYNRPTSMKTLNYEANLLEPIRDQKNASFEKVVVERAVPGIPKMCTKLPGKVLCNFGRSTYIINTKERKLDSESLEKIVGMIHQRVLEGDKSFEFSITEPRWGMGDRVPLHGNSELPIHSVIKQTQFSDDPSSGIGNMEPLMVECSPVKRETFSSISDRPDTQSIETTYECNLHLLKYKREIAQSAKSKPADQAQASLTNDTNTEKVIVSKAKAKMCSTPLNVRQYSAECATTGFEWCPTSTYKPCETSPLPICIPWCNPFLVGKENEMPQLESRLDNLDQALYDPSNDFQSQVHGSNAQQSDVKVMNPPLITQMATYRQPCGIVVPLSSSVDISQNGGEPPSPVQSVNSMNIPASNPEESNVNMTEIVNKPIGFIIPSQAKTRPVLLTHAVA